ncbi:MAG: sulfoxide reductase heme-binding subunit YedZ [Sulfuritalea sp.]|jgi:methionine sulfoxide reductase heme-binding subunit|nr:sulfoxide reductase heme-binding subunit YedZ [Sulfuritalea sp.]
MSDKYIKSLILYIKLLVFLLSLIPLFRLIYLGFNDALGANPIEFVERSTGTWALVFLMLTLSMTPIRQWSGINSFIQFRRMLGLFMFFYACLHIISYLWLDHSFNLNEIFKDIIKHPYVLVGFTAFLLLIPLAITSTKAMMKRLGGRWKLLHRLIYLIGLLAVLHFLWLVKKDLTEPLVYASIFFSLIALRFIYKYRTHFKLSLVRR